jgi:sugar/nucleoside kinase (ribokinase family)
MAEFDVLVLGDANPDLVFRGGDVEPAFGQQEKLVDEALLTIGGSGAIFACAAAKLGLSVAFCGVVGDDAFGRFMAEALAERGVNLGGLVVDASRPTGVTAVLSSTNDRAMLTATGTVADLSGASVDRELLGAARHVHVPSYFLQTSLRPDLPGLFREVHDAGGTTSLDPNWDPTGHWNDGLLGLLPAIDVFLPNAAEACLISGADDIDAASESLAGRGAVVPIKLGDGGAMVQLGTGEAIRVPRISVDVVDTIGAGDAFDAGFLLGWFEGWPLDRALRFANVCGGLSCRAAGGTDAQSGRDEALAHLPEIAGSPTPQ